MGRISKRTGTLLSLTIALLWFRSYQGDVLMHFDGSSAMLLIDGRICQPFTGRCPNRWRQLDPGWHVLSRDRLTALDDISLPLLLPLMLIGLPTLVLWMADLIRCLRPRVGRR